MDQGREYLPLMQERNKWNKTKRNFSPGDLVVIVDDTAPRNSWLMGRVVEALPGAKGLVRSVMVKTKTNILQRPINKLCLLLEATEWHTHTHTHTQCSILESRAPLIRWCRTLTFFDVIHFWTSNSWHFSKLNTFTLQLRLRSMDYFPIWYLVYLYIAMNCGSALV